jgi:hypothetical protein
MASTVAFARELLQQFGFCAGQMKLTSVLALAHQADFCRSTARVP